MSGLAPLISSCSVLYVLLCSIYVCNVRCTEIYEGVRGAAFGTVLRPYAALKWMMEFGEFARVLPAGSVLVRAAREEFCSGSDPSVGRFT
jgi:hypothetical protein